MTGKTVLIIEDDPTLLRGLTDNFESRGYRVQTACDGREGLDKALAEHPDLILLDIMLPEINGYEICRVIRENELLTPIIMLTAKGQEEDVVRGLNQGADDYVTKPFSIRELLARANAFLRRQNAKETQVYRFGDCLLDLRSHKLSKNGVDIPLRPKEFGILTYFLQRDGRVLTREEILHRVWDRSLFLSIRSVDRWIASLRGKIEPDPHHPTYIRTIPGVGYRFETAQEKSGDSPAL